MNRLLPRAASVLSRAGLRAMPWIVSTAAVAFGSWVLRALPAIASHGPLAAVGIGGIILRVGFAIAAVSAGAFALGAGLEGRWFSADRARRQRFTALAAIGAMGVAVGTFIMFGPLAGFGIARSASVIGGAGLLAALSAWSTWSLRRWRPRASESPQAIEAGVTDVWIARDLGRVKTPAT